ncbi:MAG: hypothetical protein ACI9XK_003156 [Granulosicoccus sp.]|jgi:hypothetical protein
MAAPEKAKLAIDLRIIQAMGLRRSRDNNTDIEANAAITPKDLTWPIRATSPGFLRHPSTYPSAQPVPSRPSERVENPSAWPRTGNISPLISPDKYKNAT